VGSIPAGVRSDLRIVHDSLALHTGCNTAGGSVHVSGATLVVRLLESTDAGCRPSAAPVQEAVLEVLQGTVTYAIDGQGLTLTRGDRGLVFRAD
jgi:heat shock protein HslJ